MKAALLPLTALLFACGAAESPRQQAIPAPTPAADRDAAGFPWPDRPIAEIVSPTWLNERDRDQARETEQVFAAAGVKPGQTVADIGAGAGYYVMRLSPAVGPNGRVLAEDIMPDYLAALKTRVERARLGNVTLVQGTADDPKLPKDAVDVAFLIHMYHEIEQPYGLLHRLTHSFKPGGRLAITDLDRRPENHGTPPALLKCEVEAVGYRQIDFRQLEGGVGYLALFEPPSAENLPAPADIKPCRG